MRRTLLMGTAVALVVAAVFLASALPALAGDGGASVAPKYGPCSTGIPEPSEADQCHFVFTPSEIRNGQVHDNSRSDGPPSGGRAEHETPVCSDLQSGKLVITPSGNINGHCSGQAR
jgi:hypothetical protein